MVKFWNVVWQTVASTGLPVNYSTQRPAHILCALGTKLIYFIVRLLKAKKVLNEKNK